MLRQAANESRTGHTIGIFERLIRSAERAWKRRETAKELHALTDWELRDIGIHRADIPRVVRQSDERAQDARPAASRATAGTPAQGNRVTA
ncbi:DUF1127 domain-containing protein [Roseovarius spongiae]|uniref:DUF1127 domain-containing protein n=2 Tax=Roseovarius spongiae TaxID=2320272 RepID=A0A3A8B7N5_9RHOB|nr:DUF1127 domain-containing protein [Roseovarius spongiae]